MLSLTQPKHQTVYATSEKQKSSRLTAAKASLEVLLQSQAIVAKGTQECERKTKSDEFFANVILIKPPKKQSYRELKGENPSTVPLSSSRIRKMQCFLLEPMKN